MQRVLNSHAYAAASKPSCARRWTPCCRRCARPAAHRSATASVCARKPFCAHLGIPFTYDPGPGLLSMEAIASPPAYDRRARRCATTTSPARWCCRSNMATDLAPMMGRWMARAGRELLAAADALIPVPLHWFRLWSRCFNQSAALAGAISQYCGVPVLHEALKRVRATPQDAATGRLVEERARRQCARRLPRAG